MAFVGFGGDGLSACSSPGWFIRRRLVGLKGVFAAVLIGVPLPLCSCGVIPTGLGMKRDGASDGSMWASWSARRRRGRFDFGQWRFLGAAATPSFRY